MISFPFDSQITGTDEAGLPIYDRASNSEDLSRWFASFFTNGIFATSGFAVTVSGLTVSVAPGDCLINGRYGYEKETRTFKIAGGGAQPRIDTVVLRLDMSLDVRSIDLYVKTGTAASSPAVPALIRDDTMWELGIANIRVEASQVAVSQSAVTDTRLDTTRCGIVAQAMKTIDTSTYYAQIQSDLAYFKDTEQAAFNEWLLSIHNTLDGDTAGNLLNLINANATAINEKASMKTATATLPASRWSQYDSYSPIKQYVSVPNVPAAGDDNAVIVTPAPISHDKYYECGVRCTDQSNWTLGFECTTIPSEDLTVNVLILT